MVVFSFSISYHLIYGSSTSIYQQGMGMGYNAEYIIFVKIDSGERRNIICGIMKEMGFSRNRTNIWKFNFHILVGILVFIFISGLLFWVAPVAYAGEVVFE